MTITSDMVPKKGGAKQDATELLGEKKPAPKKPSTLLPEGKVLMKMERENYSWATPNGVIFTKDHPYQLVDKAEAGELLQFNFREVAPEEIVEYYKNYAE